MIAAGFIVAGAAITVWDSPARVDVSADAASVESRAAPPATAAAAPARESLANVPPSARTAGRDTPTVGALAPYRVAKAEALIRRRLPCLGCHRLGDAGGRIGPDLTDVGDRRSIDFIRRMIRDPRATVPGTIMPRVPMPEETLDLVAAYLAAPGSDADAGAGRDGQASGVRGATPAGRASADGGFDDGAVGGAPASDVQGTTPTGRPPAQGGFDDGAAAEPGGEAPAAPAAGAGSGSADGAALYARYCAACHGADGGGDGPNARHLPVPPTAHADSAYMSRRPDDALFDAVYAGGRIMGRSHRMPAWGRTLSGEEIRALVAYMRELCGCRGPAWSRDGRGGRSLDGRENRSFEGREDGA